MPLRDEFERRRRWLASVTPDLSFDVDKNASDDEAVCSQPNELLVVGNSDAAIDPVAEHGADLDSEVPSATKVIAVIESGTPMVHTRSATMSPMIAVTPTTKINATMKQTQPPP